MVKRTRQKKNKQKKKLSRIEIIEQIIQRLSERIDRLSEENEIGFKELRENIAKTSEEIKKLKTEVSRLTGSWGEFVEGMIEPSAIKFMEEKGFKVVEIHQEAKVSRNGMNAEYDLYLVCEKKSNNKKRERLFY